MTQVQSFKDNLQRKGLKATRCRMALLQVTESAGSALSANEIMDYLNHEKVKADPVTVYRNLETLVEAHLLTRIQSPDRSNRYGYCRSPAGEPGENHHHHIVCEKCGRIAEVENCIIEETAALLGVQVDKATGFQLTGHSLQLAGICPVCRNS